MIGIYQDEFLEYLKDNLGERIKITYKNIITPCPWCEYGQDKDHYHMYISLEAPIFHCFHAGCEKGGTLRKLLMRIEGSDVSDDFIDKEKLNEYKQKQIFKDRDLTEKQFIIPPLRVSAFPNKEFYLKKRLKFSNIYPESIKGLIFDVDEFFKINEIPIDSKLFRIKDYLHSNFVGFLTEHNTTVMFRNVDSSQSFSFFKQKLYETPFLDYYKLPGGDKNSNKIVLAEGIFDIFAEQIFDNLNLKSGVSLYASALSFNFQSLIKSVVFYEQTFRPDVVILSDRGIDLRKYQNLLTYNSHIINTLKVFYNKTGKDFNDTPVTPEKFNIDMRRRNKR